MAGSRPILHMTVSGQACIQCVLKVKVKVKRHVMRGYCHQTYILPIFTISVASSELIYRPIGTGTTPYATGRGGRLRFTPSVYKYQVLYT